MKSSVSRSMFFMTIGLLFVGVQTFPTTTGPSTNTTMGPSTTTTTGSPTTQEPPTPLVECTQDKDENCRTFLCINGRWEPWEFTATPECCAQQQQEQGYMHPRCYVI